MALHLQVIPHEGEPYVVKTNLFVVVATERKFKIRASEFVNGIGMEHLAYMAYEASKQAGVAVPPIFDDFVKKLDEVNIVDDEPDNPTTGGH